jgi:hypothetical protein
MVRHEHECSRAAGRRRDRLALYGSQDKEPGPDLGMTVYQTAMRARIISRCRVSCRTPRPLFREHEPGHFPSDVQLARTACVCFEVEENDVHRSSADQRRHEWVIHGGTRAKSSEIPSVEPKVFQRYATTNESSPVACATSRQALPVTKLTLYEAWSS